MSAARLAAAKVLHVDYLVLGAGSAGCVLANRLSASPGNEVQVVEAGSWHKYNLMKVIPAGVYAVFKDPALNWNYESEPEPGCNGRRITLPRGKVVGGSSSINAMVYMRGHPKDYDRWAKDFGLTDWSYDKCLPYFKRAETSERGEDAWRGGSGPLGVSQGKLKTPLFDALFAAGKTSGQGTSTDLNGFKPEGVARLDSTTKNGARCSAADAYLTPVLDHRPNLNLETEALIERVLLEDCKAVGAEYVKGGERFTVLARKEVILACGAIKTPQLLMLSGIGPADHLHEHGIDVVHDVPAVGENLQDHLAIDTGFHCTKGTSLFSSAGEVEGWTPTTMEYLNNPLYKAMVGARWLLTRDGPAASNVFEMGGLVFGNEEVDYPNLQYHFAPVYTEADGEKNVMLIQGYHMQIDQLRPEGRGRVTLRSAAPEDSPKALFNYLQHPTDVKELIEAHHTAQRLLGQPAFDNFRGSRIDPAPGVISDPEVEQYVRDTASTDYHPSGTCMMSATPSEGVVDAQLRVKGIANLRVVDASVMPRIVSGNLNAPTIMIAEKASDIILGNQPLPPADPPATFHFEKAR